MAWGFAIYRVCDLLLHQHKVAIGTVTQLPMWIVPCSIPNWINSDLYLLYVTLDTLSQRSQTLSLAQRQDKMTEADIISYHDGALCYLIRD